jgi:hypothetical protein
VFPTDPAGAATLQAPAANPTVRKPTQPNPSGLDWLDLGAQADSLQTDAAPGAGIAVPEQAPEAPRLEIPVDGSDLDALLGGSAQSEAESQALLQQLFGGTPLEGLPPTGPQGPRTISWGELKSRFGS